jgi:hypothetical protein
MISIADLEKVINENNINLDEYAEALNNKTDAFSKIIDDALIAAAKNNKRRVVIKFIIDKIENLFAMLKCMSTYKTNDFAVNVADLTYYSKNEKSMIDRVINDEDRNTKLKFILFDMGNVIFNLKDSKLQYQFFKNNSLYLDMMNVCLKGAYIKDVTVTFEY